MPERQGRIETIIRKNIADIIQFKVKNPKLGFLTVSDVKVSKDFSVAKVLVSFFFDKDKKPGMEILEKSKGFIRSELSHTLDTRRCPEIVFILDDGFEKEARIEAALERGKKKTKLKD